MTALIASVVMAASSTAYSPCSSGTIMADGTKTRFGSAASNRLPMHTRIWLLGRGFHRRHLFTIRDRGSRVVDLDLWTPSCSDAVRWGRRRVHFRIVGHGE